MLNKKSNSGIFSSILLVSAVLFWGCGDQMKKEELTLQSTCPPGMELVNGECKVRSMYQQYESLQNGGLGGLKTGLPPGIKDGYSPEQIDLGRYLFFDPLLSSTNKVSCASCHQPNAGFSDGKRFSQGVDSQTTSRSTPTLWNMAFSKHFFWDARASSMEEQVLGPLYHEHEMANTEKGLLEKLNNNSTYRDLFKIAFPENIENSITPNQVYTSLAAFESSLISLNSRYDQYAHGYHEALDSIEIAGLNVFRSFVARCAECHTPPLFTNRQIAVIGTMDTENRPFDRGAGVTFKDSTMDGGFKVPTLRNIERTAPYMHDGKFATLKEAVTFYTLGRGHAVPDSLDLKLHWHIWEPQLKEKEIDQIVAFLKTLTDETFLPQIPKKLPSGLPLN